MIAAKFVIVAVVGYLLGSIPFGILICRRMAKVDVRQYGSGKVGTTNVLRTAGNKAAVLVFVLDLLKGVAAVVIAGLIVGRDYSWWRPGGSHLFRWHGGPVSPSSSVWRRNFHHWSWTHQVCFLGFDFRSGKHLCRINTPHHI
jgi:hypothetical protein